MTWEMLGLQDPHSPFMYHFMLMHEFTISIMTMIMCVITYMISFMMMNKLTNRFLLKNNPIEMAWTILPMFVLILLALPAIEILYLTEANWPSKMSIKAIGHQWYWSYEYPEFNIQFDSYMKESLTPQSFRLMEVDTRMVIPTKKIIRILCTSSDVIHSWALPSMAIKMDAIPGRINQIHTTKTYPGLVFGQCSEICGMNHSFMPIVMEAIKHKLFLKWITMKNKII